MAEASYQIYFVVDGFELVGYRSFTAASDGDALEVANALVAVCKDACERAELWRDGVMLFRVDPAASDPPPTVGANSAAIVRALEQSLANSTWAIARSRGLRAKLGRRLT